METGGAVIGALRGVLVLDARDWSPAIGRARGDLSGLRGALEQVGGAIEELSRKARTLGTGLTVGLTVPLGALAVASNRTASGFEASMKRVEAALRGVTGGELRQLSDAARDLGPKVGKGATEAADGIEALGLAGVATADILGGALKASLDLAAAGAAPVSDAAALVTDAMGQFKVTAGQLPQVVGDVVGALDASKFEFIDFQQAMAQGGGVAAAAGINFRDFATAIAATSTQFSSGSDAGTSFKTYIQSLVTVSKQAEYAMKKLGIEFFDLRTGRMKPLAEQAEILQRTLGGLSDRSKTEALKTIFGSDAARTAIGLMEKGAKGIADVQREIVSGDVAGKIGKRMEGEAAATMRVAHAFESLKIAIGEAGLTAIITSVKNAFAGFLETIAHANPALLKVGVAIGAVAAALGPLAIVAGHIAAVVIARVAMGFGLLGKIVGAIISPITALAEAVGWLAGRIAVGEAVAVLGRAFMSLTNPIGLAVTAILLFRDSIVPALAAVWKQMQDTLGPPLTALWQQLGNVVSSVSSGPIAAGIGSIISLLQGLLDVAGTVVAGIVELVGTVLVAGLQMLIRTISGVVSVVQGVVNAVSALLRGDFAGAFSAAGDAVDAAMQTVIDIVTMAVPGLTVPLQVVYEAAKKFFVEGFSWVANAFTGVISGAVNWVASAFPTIVAAAKSVYEGVKGWLVDKFGAIAAWIGSTAKWIGDQYAALKDKLGLGGAKSGNASGSPVAAPAAPAEPRSGGLPRTVDLAQPKADKAKGGAAGRSRQYDAENREQLRIQAELDAARERGDKEAQKRIQDQLALSKQVEAYQRTGLSLDQARAAAQRDINAVQKAREEMVAREIADEQASAALDVARLGTDQQLIETLERQAELKRRIAYYYELTKNLAEATRLAEADQARADDARAAVRQRWFEDDDRERAVRVARERGDSEERVRQLQREIDIRQRARELEERGGLSAADAAARAVTEWDEENKARLLGNVRSTFRDGIRAALDGNLGDFLKNWWKDRIAKGMEEAINSLADLVARLFSKIGKGSGSDVEGAVEGVGGIFQKLFGKSPDWSIQNLSGGTNRALDSYLKSVPAFATGGSFRVGGMSGVDANLVAFRATKGEMVDIRKPGNDNAGRPITLHVIGEEGPMFRPAIRAESAGQAVQVVSSTQRREGLRARQRYGR